MARSHLDDVYRFLLYATGDAAVAEDLAAETMERALRDYAKYDPSRSKPRAWLLVIARSAMLDHFRREQRRRRYSWRHSTAPTGATGRASPTTCRRRSRPGCTGSAPATAR